MIVNHALHSFSQAFTKRLWVIMINCDLCGKVEDRLNTALIEGVKLDVCAACSKFGKVIATVQRPSAKEQHRQYKQQEAKEEKIEILVDNYADLIKKRRESMGLTQKDFAYKVNEKESIIHKIETGNFIPTLLLARKLEKVLGVKLIEEYHEERGTLKRKKEEGFRLGDFIKMK